MFRVGIVKTQDAQNARVRVTFPDRNQMTSWWLPIVVGKAQNDKAYWMPDVGEQVVCLMDAHDEDGAVLGSIYSSADAAPVNSADKWHLAMKDGASFEYDRSSHALAVSIPDHGTVTITIKGAIIQIDASGNINLIGKGENDAGGNVNLTATGDVKLKTSSHSDSVNGIIDTYNSHTHPDPPGRDHGGAESTDELGRGE